MESPNSSELGRMLTRDAFLRPQLEAADDAAVEEEDERAGEDAELPPDPS